MNIKTLLTLSLLVASFNAQSAVTACPSGWTKSADGLTCVFEEKKTETPNKVSNTAKPVCISGFTYSSTTTKCEKNTIASQFTANKAYAYMGGLKFGPDPQEEDKCFNFPETQTFQPANSYPSGGGNCACNSGFQYNGLSGDSASCKSCLSERSKFTFNAGYSKDFGIFYYTMNKNGWVRFIRFDENNNKTDWFYLKSGDKISILNGYVSGGSTYCGRAVYVNGRLLTNYYKESYTCYYHFHYYNSSGSYIGNMDIDYCDLKPLD